MQKRAAMCFEKLVILDPVGASWAAMGAVWHFHQTLNCHKEELLERET